MKSKNIKELYPDWNQKLPTSTVVVGTRSFSKRDLNNGEYVGLTIVPRNENHPTADLGVFSVDFIDNGLVVNTQSDRDPGNKLGINPNVATVSGYRNTDPKSLVHEDIHFRVDLNAGPSQIEPCKSAVIHSYGFDEDTLEQFLRDDNYILHEGIDEVVLRSGTDQVPFFVADVEPSDWTTQVTSDTSINFINNEKMGEYKKKATSTVEEDQSSTSSSSSQNPDQDSTSAVGQDEIDFSLNFRRPSSEDFDVSFDDVAGLESVKQRAKVVYSLSLDNVRKRISEYGDIFTPAEGNAVLLYGPPGCGKTMIAKAIASRFDEMSDRPVAFAEVEASDILGMYQGVSEKRLSIAFEEAHRKARDNYYTILMFDELESLVQDRSGDVKTHHQQLTATFLQEMNSIDRNILIIGATNLPYELDTAAVRRFNTEIFVPHPGREGLKGFWEMRLEDINTEESFGNQDVEDLAKASMDFAPSELDNRLLQSEIQSDLVLSAMRDEERPITKEYLLNKLDDLEPQVIDRYVADIGNDYQQMEGYQELQEYVRERLMRNVDSDSDTSGSRKGDGDSDTSDSREGNETSDTSDSQDSNDTSDTQ